MEKQVTEIREGLKELRETEERNSLAVQQALDVYEELKEKVREDEHEYGPALLNCKTDQSDRKRIYAVCDFKHFWRPC